MRHRLLPLFALTLTAGCHGALASVFTPRYANGQAVYAPRTRPVTAATTGATTAQTTSPAAGDPQAFLNGLDQHLRSRGYSPNGAAIRNNAMPATGLMAYAIEAQQGLCYSAIAIGDTGTDLNMMLLGPTGQTESYNVQPDSTPYVSFCARQAGRYVVRLQMSRGQGGYYYLAYVGQAGSDANLVAYLGGGGQSGAAAGTTQTPPAPQVAQLDAGTRSRVTQQDGELLPERFTRAGEPSGLVLAEREERLFPLNLVSSACYAFATFGGPGTRDTDVFVVDGSGEELASDARVDLDAIVRFCPPSDGTYQLRTRLYSGAGPVFVAGWVQPRQVTGPTGPATGPTTTPVTTGPVISTTSVASGGLDEAFALVNVDMQARGYTVQGEPQQGDLDEGQLRDFDVSVERNKCYAMVAISSGGIRNVNVEVRDGSRVVAHEDESSSRAFVRICSNDAGNRTVRVTAAEGEGSVQFAVFQFMRGNQGFGLTGLTYLNLSEVAQLLEAESFTPSIAFDIGTARLSAAGRAHTQQLQLVGGHCYAIAAAAGDGIGSLSVRLERNGDTLVENNTGSSSPVIRHCAQTDGRYQLKVTSGSGSGTYAFEVFEQASQ